MDTEPRLTTEAKQSSDDPSSIRFNLKNLLWFTSLIAVGLGAFGPYCSPFLMISTLVLTRIIYLWISQSTPFVFEKNFLMQAAVFLVIFFTFLVFILSNVENYNPNRQNRSRNFARHIMLLLLNYDTVHQHWLEPYTTDKNGNWLHPWRTSLLPYIYEQPLYNSLDLNSAWKEKENIKLLQNRTILDFKSSVSDTWDQDDQLTNYFAIVDSETVWNPNAQVSSSDITDDASQTIVLMEVFNREVAWYEPKDLTIDEAVSILTGKDDSERMREGFLYSKRVRGGYLNRRVVGFADGEAKIIGIIKDPQIARALLTRAGGEEIPEDWETVAPEVTIWMIIHWGSCISTLLYILLALFPVFKAFRNSKAIDAA